MDGQDDEGVAKKGLQVSTYLPTTSKMSEPGIISPIKLLQRR